MLWRHKRTSRQQPNKCDSIMLRLQLTLLDTCLKPLSTHMHFGREVSQAQDKKSLRDWQREREREREDILYWRVCVCLSVCLSICVCKRVRQRIEIGEIVCVSEREIRDSVCVCVEWETKCVCVFVCTRERR